MFYQLLIFFASALVCLVAITFLGEIYIDYQRQRNIRAFQRMYGTQTY